MRCNKSILEISSKTNYDLRNSPHWILLDVSYVQGKFLLSLFEYVMILNHVFVRRIICNMLAVHENELSESRKVSIRYDDSTRTYYCFYRSSPEVILSYELNQQKWTVETMEYKDGLENKFNELFKDRNIPFEEQIRYVINYLDAYFADQPQQKISVINRRTYSFGWFRNLRGIRRYASEDILTEQLPVLQRYSAPEKSKNDQIISVKSLAESFYTDDSNRIRTRRVPSLAEDLNRTIPSPSSNKAPAISEIWLNVQANDMDQFQKKLGNRLSEEQLRKLAEKFVTYFSGTFQCNVGHQCQLEYDCRTWYFTILKVEFLATKSSEMTKPPKTKLVFLIDGIPHYVRG